MEVVEKGAYTVREAAVRLGVGTPAIYELVAGNRIPHMRIGGSIRIPVKAFEDWMQSETSQTRTR